MDQEIMRKAVSYAVTHKDEMPENIKKFIDDLYEYDKAGQRLQTIKDQSVASIKKIDEQIDQLIGSMDAVVKIIGRELGEEKANELALKYKSPEEIK